jgi:hypothetical protein
MIKVYSKIEPDLLLHIVFRKEEMTGRTDIVPAAHFIQVAALKLEENKTFKPHQHMWNMTGPGPRIAQESWVVIEGIVECTYYDIDQQIIQVETLGPGDITITLEGGHNYLAVKDSLVYEFKTGPYLGQILDKTFI